MSKLKWDQIGERLFETGVDRGVLFVQENGTYEKGVAWNGLSKVSESPSGAEATPLYANNHKYLNLLSTEEYAGTIEAYTYPDEFAKCNGESEMLKGVTIGQQKRQPFGFAYRTLIGNDTDGTSHGYKIHLVYGALASPSSEEHESANADPNVNPLSWEFSTTPVEVENCEPTATLEIDSTKVTAAQMLKIEEILYGKDATASGNDGVEPRLPLPDEIVTILKTVTE